MTYPPQDPYGQQPGGYGQQPDPYGQYGQQQQPGPYGQPYPGQQPTGGFAQPGYQPTQQYPAGYDPSQQYGYPGGPGGQPPQKNNKAMIFSIVGVVAVLVAAFLVTGLWAPGFLVGDEEAAPPPTSETTTPEQGPSGENTEVPPVDPNEPSQQPEQPPTTDSQAPSTPETTPPPSKPKITAAQAAKTADGFLAAVKSRNAGKATSYSCGSSSSTAKSEIKNKLKAKRDGTPTARSGSGSYKVPITGTSRGKKIGDNSYVAVMSDFRSGNKPCVLLVLALPDFG